MCVYSCESFVSREMRSQPIVGSALASARGEIIGKFVTFCAGELLILSRAAWKSAQEVTGQIYVLMTATVVCGSRREWLRGQCVELGEGHFLGRLNLLSFCFCKRFCY